MHQSQNPPRYLGGYQASAILALARDLSELNGVALKSESKRTMFVRNSFTMGWA